MTHSSLCIHVGLAGLLFCLAITTRPSLSAAAESREPATTVYYVSTRGSDHWSGRLPAPAVDRQDGPFATLTAARDAIRRLKATNGLPGAAEVIVLEGSYHLTESFVLTAIGGVFRLQTRLATPLVDQRPINLNQALPCLCLVGLDSGEKAGRRRFDPPSGRCPIPGNLPSPADKPSSVVSK